LCRQVRFLVDELEVLFALPAGADAAESVTSLSAARQAGSVVEPMSTNPPEWRGDQRPCTRCGASSYSVLTKAPMSSGGLAERTVQNHADDNSPADQDCDFSRATTSSG
jgi:hypothetical protein